MKNAEKTDHFGEFVESWESSVATNGCADETR